MEKFKTILEAVQSAKEEFIKWEENSGNKINLLPQQFNIQLFEDDEGVTWYGAEFMENEGNWDQGICWYSGTLAESIFIEPKRFYFDAYRWEDEWTDRGKETFAIVQKGYVLFGKGETLDLAVQDCKEWLDPEGFEKLQNAFENGELRSYYEGDDGEMVHTNEPQLIKDYLNYTI